MTELWLNFVSENGEPRRIQVSGQRFVVGRHSDCDLTITDSRLSRQHARIDVFGDFFTISDLGSSNGTEVNGAILREPVVLKNQDRISFGGFPATVELVSDQPAPRPRKEAGPKSAVAETSESVGSSIPAAVLIAAPLLALALVLCGGGAVFYASIDKKTEPSGSPGGSPTWTIDDTPDDKPTASVSPTPSGGPTGVPPSPTGNTPPATPEVSDEKKAVEVNAAAFLRAVALKDPNAYLKSNEIDVVAVRIAQLKNSTAFAENLRAAKNFGSQFQSMAQSKGLKPQFLLAAALAELGTNRGNPVETAQRMLPVFGELRVSLANNLADDNLLMAAAYQQGRAGEYKSLRNTLEALAKKSKGTSPREIRTIWFVKQQGKLSDAEFEFALRFLAAGTIAQNPAQFNVRAEAVTF